MQPKSKTYSTLGPLLRREVREIANSLKGGNGGAIVVPFKDGVRQTPSFIPRYSSVSANLQALERLKQALSAMGCEKAISIDEAGKSRSVLG